MGNKLELTWLGKENEIKIEPRILIENKELSNIENDPNTENMIIHGDNLLTLKALEHKYAGKVKCIYIDPPYNTGKAFEHYDDNLEHSTWLSLIKPRLEILRNLLSDKEDVDSVIELVRSAGGRIVKEPQDTFWGGYHAYFSDLDGYYWEVAWGSNFKFDENGLLKF